MRVITGKRVAEIYFSMQRHFDNHNYSITDYSWHPINIPIERYIKQFPVKYCQILGDHVKTERKLFDLLIPSFVEKDWFITDFVEDLEQRTQESILWKDRLSAVKYNFSQSVHIIINEDIKFNKTFPDKLLDMCINNEIQIEVFCIYILILNLQFNDNFIWNKTPFGDRTEAYMKLIKFSQDKYKSIFKKIMQNNG